MESTWPAAWPNVEPTDALHILDPIGNVLLQLQKTISIKAPAVHGTSPTHGEFLNLEFAEEELVAQDGALQDLYDETSTHLQQPPSTAKDGARDLRESQSEMGEESEPHFTQTIYLRVSSKHLMLASAMFNSMLNSTTFVEGRNLQSSGNLVIPLSDDSDALIILMYVVHGIMKKVPRHVTFDILTKLAILTDYYGLHEAVKFVSEKWISGSKKKNAFPRSLGPTIIPWLFISWVFKKRSEFEKITRILELESDDGWLEGNIDKEFLFPDSIIRKIKEYRVNAIEHVIAVVHDHITTYLTSEILCSKDQQFACDAIILGSLLKSSVAIGIWPRPTDPYHGMTFKILASNVREMQVLDECNQPQKCCLCSGSDHAPLDHGVKTAIEASIKSVKNQRGLELSSFLPEI